VDREIHDKIFSLVPNQFGGTVSCWLRKVLMKNTPTASAQRRAIRLLERFKKEGRPFFLGVGFLPAAHAIRRAEEVIFGSL
jgi:hypothetical protein